MYYDISSIDTELRNSNRSIDEARFSVLTIISWKMDMWGAGVGWCSEGGVSVREGGNTPWQRWAGYCVLATSAGCITYHTAHSCGTHRTGRGTGSWAAGRAGDTSASRGNPCCDTIMLLIMIMAIMRLMFMIMILRTYTWILPPSCRRARSCRRRAC